MWTDKQLVQGASVIAGAIIIAAIIAAITFYQVRSLDNTFSVTGSAKTSVRADRAKLTIQVSRPTFEGQVPATYTRVEGDVKAVAAFFKRSGIDTEHITENPVFVDQEWSGDNNGPRRYNVRSSVTVASDDVEKIADLSKQVGTLVNQGYAVSPQQPEYYVSTLPDLRVQLLGDALKDARNRAEQIAKSAGTSVGALKSSASGVVQVLPPNSVDVSDYGNYDTSSIEKDVMVTVRATFFVK